MGFLPEAHTDFIFAVLAQDFGFVGVLVLLLIFIIVFWRILLIALASEKNFPRLFSVGVLTFIFVHLLINVGMNIGLLPIIGLPLPFLSYGGSSLIMFFISIGFLQAIKISK